MENDRHWWALPLLSGLPILSFKMLFILFMINSIPARLKKGDPDMRRGTLSILNALLLLDK